jgi:hypothetical protein
MTTDSITRLIYAIIETARKIRESRAAEAIAERREPALLLGNVDIFNGLLMHVMTTRAILIVSSEEVENTVRGIAKLAQNNPLSHAETCIMSACIGTLANFEPAIMDEWTAAILTESVSFDISHPDSEITKGWQARGWFQFNETLYCAKHCLEFARDARQLARLEASRMQSRDTTLDSIIEDCLPTILRFHANMPPATLAQFAHLFAQYIRDAPQLTAFQRVKKARELVVLTGGDERYIGNRISESIGWKLHTRLRKIL